MKPLDAEQENKLREFGKRYWHRPVVEDIITFMREQAEQSKGAKHVKSK